MDYKFHCHVIEFFCTPITGFVNGSFCSSVVCSGDPVVAESRSGELYSNNAPKSSEKSSANNEIFIFFCLRYLEQNFRYGYNLIWFHYGKEIPLEVRNIVVRNYFMPYLNKR